MDGRSLALAMALALGAGPVAPPEPDAVLVAVAADIEALGATHPALAAFRAASHLDVAGARIDYAYRTHDPARTGGWTAGVPEPDADGLWFHIDVHEPTSTAQIHTQPMVEPLCLGGRRVSFLVLAGERLEGVAGEFRAILGRRGVVPCPG
jgi:hypothetical protein